MQFMQALCQWQHVIKYLPEYCCKGMLEKGVGSGSHTLESFARWGQCPPANEMTPNYPGMLCLGWLTYRAMNLSGKTRHLVFRSDLVKLIVWFLNWYTIFGGKAQPKWCNQPLVCSIVFSLDDWRWWGLTKHSQLLLLWIQCVYGNTPIIYNIW